MNVIHTFPVASMEADYSPFLRFTMRGALRGSCSTLRILVHTFLIACLAVCSGRDPFSLPCTLFPHLILVPISVGTHSGCPKKTIVVPRALCRLLVPLSRCGKLVFASCS